LGVAGVKSGASYVHEVKGNKSGTIWPYDSKGGATIGNKGEWTAHAGVAIAPHEALALKECVNRTQQKAIPPDGKKGRTRLSRRVGKIDLLKLIQREGEKVRN